MVCKETIEMRYWVRVGLGKLWQWQYYGPFAERSEAEAVAVKVFGEVVEVWPSDGIRKVD